MGVLSDLYQYRQYGKDKEYVVNPKRKNDDLTLEDYWRILKHSYGWGDSDEISGDGIPSIDPSALSSADPATANAILSGLMQAANLFARGTPVGPFVTVMKAIGHALTGLADDGGGIEISPELADTLSILSEALGGGGTSQSIATQAAIADAIASGMFGGAGEGPGSNAGIDATVADAVASGMFGGVGEGPGGDF